jgi:hypothetical protein
MPNAIPFRNNSIHPHSLLQHATMGKHRGVALAGTWAPHHRTRSEAADSLPSAAVLCLYSTLCMTSSALSIRLRRTGVVLTEQDIAPTSEIGSQTKGAPRMEYYGSLTYH